MKKNIICAVALIFATTIICINPYAQETGRLTDNRDGQVYKTVRIGNQTWMAENLNYYTSTGSWCYENSSSNCNTYGRLYYWETALNVCPNGWHLPSDDEWTELIDFLGGFQVAGWKMKETGTAHWDDPNTRATNESGFSVIPAGYCFASDHPMTDFQLKGTHTYFWSSTEDYSQNAWLYYLSNEQIPVLRNSNKKNEGFSVRCIKDSYSNEKYDRPTPTNRETENNSSQKFLDKFNDADSDANRYYRTKFSDKWAKRNEANNVRNKFAKLLEDYEYLPTSFKNSEQGIKIKKRIKARISNMTYEYQNTY